MNDTKVGMLGLALSIIMALSIFFLSLVERRQYGPVMHRPMFETYFPKVFGISCACNNISRRFSIRCLILGFYIMQILHYFLWVKNKDKENIYANSMRLFGIVFLEISYSLFIARCAGTEMFDSHTIPKRFIFMTWFSMFSILVLIISFILIFIGIWTGSYIPWSEHTITGTIMIAAVLNAVVMFCLTIALVFYVLRLRKMVSEIFVGNISMLMQITFILFMCIIFSFLKVLMEGFLLMHIFNHTIFKLVDNVFAWCLLSRWIPESGLVVLLIYMTKRVDSRSQDIKHGLNQSYMHESFLSQSKLSQSKLSESSFPNRRNSSITGQSIRSVVSTRV